MGTDLAAVIERAFGTGSASRPVFAYRSHGDALAYLQQAMSDANGVALLLGPRGAGKTTTVRRFGEQFAREARTAHIDGAGESTHDFLIKILGQFGYPVGDDSIESLLRMTNVFAVRRACMGEPPVIVIDNADRMKSDALRILNTLAALIAQDRFALRLILTGGDDLGILVKHGSMDNLARRCSGTFTLQPMSARETRVYLHAALEACGEVNADDLLPLDVCDRLHRCSGGWPGRVNRAALETLSGGTDDDSPRDVAGPGSDQRSSTPKADAVRSVSSATVGSASPSLLVSLDGELRSEFSIRETKLLLGRSRLADIVLADKFVSKMHAALFWFTNALVILDLNSANGITVNSVRVRSALLKSDDIISLGHFRIKVRNAPPLDAEMAAMLDMADTVQLRQLVDVHQQRVRLELLDGHAAGPTTE